VPNQHENASCSVRTAVSTGSSKVAVQAMWASGRGRNPNMMKRRYDDDHVVFDGRGVGDGGASGSATKAPRGHLQEFEEDVVEGNGAKVAVADDGDELRVHLGDR
jgi:hypothetical protein